MHFYSDTAFIRIPIECNSAKRDARTSVTLGQCHGGAVAFDFWLWRAHNAPIVVDPPYRDVYRSSYITGALTTLFPELILQAISLSLLNPTTLFFAIITFNDGFRHGQLPKEENFGRQQIFERYLSKKKIKYEKQHRLIRISLLVKFVKVFHNNFKPPLSTI